jgi:hypothetical protein
MCRPRAAYSTAKTLEIEWESKRGLDNRASIPSIRFGREREIFRVLAVKKV